MRLKALPPRIGCLKPRISEKPPERTVRTTGRPWQRIRLRILRRDPICVVCRAQGGVEPSVEVDHITPLEQGGTDEDDNLQGLCHDHHAEKTAQEQRRRMG